jgi:hypothetical protein
MAEKQRDPTVRHESSAVHPETATINFRGHSGERYRFHAYPLDSRFKAVGGVYVFTERIFDNPTFPTKASHRSLAIGNTQSLAKALVTKAMHATLVARGANCVCVLVVADEARRIEIENDLVDANASASGLLLRLVHLSPPTTREVAVSPGADTTTPLTEPAADAP